MTYVTCTKCDRKILKSEAVMLELDQRTNTYTDKVGEVPAECSQGGFWFGKDCAEGILNPKPHTPEPWVAEEHTADEMLIFDGNAESEDPIAIVCLGKPESKANAFVLAAAPELLAACRAAKDVIGQHANCFNDPAFKADRLAFHALRTAINKAEGR